MAFVFLFAMFGACGAIAQSSLASIYDTVSAATGSDLVAANAERKPLENSPLLKTVAKDPAPGLAVCSYPNSRSLKLCDDICCMKHVS